MTEGAAMLPDALVGAVGPTEALVQERGQRLGRLGTGARVGLVGDAPTGAEQRERQVGVLDQGVGVDGDHDLTAGHGEPVIGGGGLARVLLANAANPRLTQGDRFRDARGVVGRAVVDHHDLEVAPFAREDGLDGARQDLGLVVGGDEDRHERVEVRRRDHGQRARLPQSQRTEHQDAPDGEHGADEEEQGQHDPAPGAGTGDGHAAPGQDAVVQG